MSKFLSILFFVLLCMLNRTLAGDTININTPEVKQSIDCYSSFYEDASNKLWIQDISKPDFQKNFKHTKNNYPAFGYSESAFWMRFTVKNNTKKTINLLVGYNYNLLAKLYFFKPDSSEHHFTISKCGTQEPSSKREIQHIKFFFRIQLAPSQTCTYYAYCKNITMTNLAANIYSEAEGEHQIITDMMIIFFMLGLISTLIIISAFLWAATKDFKLFYYFSFFVTSFFTYSSITGTGSLLIWKDLWKYNQLFNIVLLTITIITALQFAIQFLELKKRSSLFFYLFKALQVGIPVFSIYRISNPSAIGNKLAAAAYLLCFSLLFVVGFLGLFKKHRPALSYMLSIGIFFGLISFFIAARLDLTKYSYLAEHAWDMAMVLQPILIAIALLQHFSYMRNKNERSFAELQESEERYKTLSNLTYEGILIHDEGIIVDLNESLCKLVQYSRAELIGKNAMEMFLLPPHYATMKKNLADDHSDPYEVEIRKKDGSIIMIEIEAKIFNLKNKKLRVAAIRDITHRKKNEKELKIAKEKSEASQSQLQLITDNLPVYISRIDTNERYLFANKTYQNLLVKDDDESIIGKTIEEVIGDKAYQKAQPNIKRVLKGEPVTYDNELVTRDNKKIYVQVSYVPEIKNGEIIGFFILSNNITERKLAENALHTSEEKFAKAFHSSPVLISITELTTGIYLDVNEEALRVSGYSREEVIGSTAAKLGWISIQDRARLIDELQKKGRILDLEMEFRGKNKNSIIGLVRGEYVSISGIDCLLTVTMDITEQKKSEKDLFEIIEKIAINEKKYKDLYESLSDAFVQVDMEGNITQFNSTYLEMLGYEADEIRKLTVFDLTPKKWHESEYQIIKNEVIANGFSSVYEKEHIKKDGSVFPVELRTFLINGGDGTPEAMWAIVRDITERKKHEMEQVKHSENLESLVEARTKQLQDEILERKKYETELRQRTNELELFNKAMIDREMRIIEMKKEVNEFCRALGIEPVYDEFW